MNNEELWKDITGFEGFYQISSLGNIRTKDRYVKCRDGKMRFVKGRLCSLNQRNRYKTVTLYKDGFCQRWSVHRLVALAFISNPKKLPYIDHIDGNPSNNCIENLRWVTQKENMNNPLTKIKCSERVYTNDRNKKILETRKLKCSLNQEREVFQFSISGEFIQSFKSISEASRITGAHHSSIGNVCRRGRGGKSAGGFLWSYDRNIVPKYDPYPNNHKVVYRYNADGSFIDEWYSVADAERTLNITNVSRCARTRKHCMAGGFWWRYYKVDNIFKGTE